MCRFDGRHKETPIVSEFFRLSFCIKQIIHPLSFLFLLLHIGLNSNLKKVLE